MREVNKAAMGSGKRLVWRLRLTGSAAMRAHEVAAMKARGRMLGKRCRWQKGSGNHQPSVRDFVVMEASRRAALMTRDEDDMRPFIMNTGDAVLPYWQEERTINRSALEPCGDGGVTARCLEMTRKG